MKCSKCNALLPDGSVFCQYCGSRVENESDTLCEPPADEKPEAPVTEESPFTEDVPTVKEELPLPPKTKTRKGIFRIVSGIILIFLQAVALFSNLKTGFSDCLTDSFIYNILFLIGYFSYGIAGVLLLVYGKRAYCSGETAKLILHQTDNRVYTVIQYVAAGILSAFFTYYIILMLVDGADISIQLVFYILSEISLIIYLFFYHNKKPTYLFSASVLMFGIYNTYTIFSSLEYIIFHLSYITFTVALSYIATLAAGIIYIVLAVKLYKENFSNKTVKALGLAASLLMFFKTALYIIDFHFLPLWYISIYLPAVAIFLYTFCFPLCGKEDNARRFLKTNYLSKPLKVLNYVAIGLLALAGLCIIIAMCAQDPRRDLYDDPTLVYFGFLLLHIAMIAALFFTGKTKSKAVRVVLLVITIIALTIFGMLAFIMTEDGDSIGANSHWVGDSERIYYSNSETVYLLNFIFYLSDMAAVLVVLSELIYGAVKASHGKKYSSFKYRERCYKRVAKMHDYYKAGIITESEYLKAKAEITKNIP